MGQDVDTPSAAIAAALSSSDAEERRQGTSRLQELPLANAIPGLLRALGDSDWRVRKEATIVATTFGDVDALVAATLPVIRSSDDVGLRNAVVDVLAACGRAATAPITAALPSLDADGRKLAVDVLGRSGDPAAIGALKVVLGDVDANVRQAAIEAIAALGELDRDRVREILLEALGEADPFVQMAALDGLNALAVSVPWSVLERLIDDPTLRSSVLRAAARSDDAGAAYALAGAIGTARGAALGVALASLGELAEGPLASKVAEALQAIGAAGSSRVLRIAEGGGGEPAEQRAMALVVVAVARAPGAAAAAIRALCDRDLAVSARRALASLGLAAIGPMLARLTSAPPEGATADDEPELRAAIIEVAGGIALRDPAAAAPKLPALLDALRATARHADKEVALAAIAMVGRLGEASDVALVGDLVDSPAIAVAQAAERALVALSLRHTKAARESAARAAGSDPVSLRAVIVLGALAATGRPTLGVGADLEFLAHAVASGDMRTRRAAVGAVAEIGGATALDVLRLALTDEEPGVQLAAARALGRLSTTSAAYPTSPSPTGDPATRSTRTTDVLDLVGRSHDPDLVAAAVRAMGEAISGSASRPPEPDDPRRRDIADEMVAALGPLAQTAASVVSLAAVDALGRSPDGTRGRMAALLRALRHADEGVVMAAILKLGRSDAEVEELARCLEHPSVEVRLLSAEVLGSIDAPEPRSRLAARIAHEPDRDVRIAIDAALGVWRRDRGSGP